MIKSLHTLQLKLLITLMSILGLMPISLAAEKEEDKVSSSRSAWVIITATPNQFLKSSRIFSQKKSIALPNSKRVISKPLPISANNIISVARVSEGSKPEKIILKIPVPKQIKQALIVLIPSVNDTGEVTLTAQVCDLTSYKLGDWLFINVTTSTIRVVEDDKELEITPRSAIVSKVPLKKSKTVSISYGSRKKDDDEWSTLTNSSVVRYPSHREICIFTENTELDTINYYGLQFR